MKIVVNHLTRMQQGYICVAGVDIQNYQHVRPILAGTRLGTNLLARNGGPFDMAVVVDLGKLTPNPQRPEIEDHIFSPSSLRKMRTFPEEKFWRLLTRIAKRKLLEIFGSDLETKGTKSCAVDVGKGEASLGCLIPDSPPKFYILPREGKVGQIRIEVSDGCFGLDLGVTDIRLYCDDHLTPNERVVKNVAERVKKEENVIIGVGLTRPFSSLQGFPPVHWLQVNNIHLKSDPTWQLG
jgi:hypothetical protein